MIPKAFNSLVHHVWCLSTLATHWKRHADVIISEVGRVEGRKLIKVPPICAIGELTQGEPQNFVPVT